MSRALPAVSACTIGLMPSLRMMRRHWPSACTWLSTLLMSSSLVALHRHQLMADRQKPFADDEEAGGRQQMMDVGDAARDRILDRDHAEIGLARRDRRQRVLEGGAGHRLGVGIGLDDGDVGIGARLALECDFQLAHDRPCNSGSGFGKDAAGGLQVRRRVDPAGHGIDDGEVDRASRPPAPGAARASPAIPAARAAARRSAPARRGDRRRGRYGGSAVRRRSARWRG